MTTHLMAKPRKARSIREAAGYALKQVEAMTDIKFSHLARFERGLAGLSADNLSKLARVYTERLSRTVTIDELLAQEPAPPEIADASHP